MGSRGRTAAKSALMFDVQVSTHLILHQCLLRLWSYTVEITVDGIPWRGMSCGRENRGWLPADVDAAWCCEPDK